MDWARSVASSKLLDAGGLLLLIAVSLLLRTSELKVSFWIDEGLSVGIAGHPLFDIPGILVQDGSPPLYYMLLHGWMDMVSHRVVDVHWFSVLFALLCIPVAWWTGTTVFDRLTGWLFALFVALCPFLTDYAQEARMYSLVALLGITSLGFFLNAYLRGRRGFRIPFGIALALLIYTHNWGLFLGVSMAVCIAIMWTALPKGGPERPRLLKDALLGFGVTAVLYLPWVPTLLEQLQHTGAPWSDRPGFNTLVHAPDQVTGSFGATIALVLAGGAGLAALWRSDRFDRRVTIPCLLVMTVVPVLIPWLASQASPAWATRYLAIAVGPLLLLGAVGLRRAGRMGAVGAVLLVVMFATAGAPSWKTNGPGLGLTEPGPEGRRRRGGHAAGDGAGAVVLPEGQRRPAHAARRHAAGRGHRSRHHRLARRRGQVRLDDRQRRPDARPGQASRRRPRAPDAPDHRRRIALEGALDEPRRGPFDRVRRHPAGGSAPEVGRYRASRRRFAWTQPSAGVAVHQGA